MVFKSLLAFTSLAAVVSAAHSLLVTCPDGNKASNAACCPLFALRGDLFKHIIISNRAPVVAQCFDSS